MSVVYVHIGLPKTGTTHLQDRLWRNRDLALRDSALLYPGNVISDHFHAAVHLQPDRYLDWVDPAFAKSWPAMLAQMKAWPQKSLLSHEIYATAGPDQVRALIDDLSFADEVHVIATVRDLSRQLPSVWQENVKNQRQATFDEFVESVRLHAVTDPARRPDVPAGAPDEEPFWEFQDYVRILATWAEEVGSERVHVVTVPPTRDAPGDTLWDRFLDVLDVNPASLTIAVPSLNSSLSAPQAEFLRQLNLRLQPDDIAWQRYERIIKGQIIGEILFEAPGGAPLGLSDAQRVWAGDQAEAMISALAGAGYSIRGSLDDLRVATTGRGDAQPPTQQQVLDAALDTLAEIVKAAPLPRTGPGWKTRAANVVRRVERWALGVRRSGHL